MKVCPNCRQSYSDENLNFCLNDGGVLTIVDENSNPTLIMSQTRQTSPNDWTNYQQPTYQNQQIVPQQQFGIHGQYPPVVHGTNQTLPTVSLILGILSILLMCCWGGVPLGVPSIIIGFIGLRNVNEDPIQYGGKGLAIAGIAAGAVSLAVTVLLVIGSILGR